MIVGLGAEVGDALYCLPTLRELGSVDVRCIDRPWTRPQWTSRCLSLKRLFEAQPYINSFEVWSGEDIDLDLTTYRNGGYRIGELIPEKVARWARVKISLDKWIEVTPSEKTSGRIVINRAPRWVGKVFPWKEIVEMFRRDLIFVGTDAEHSSFCAQFGMVERLRCTDLQEVAEAIAGAELFIGAQSSPFALAEAMKVDSVLETCPTAPDCMFQRDNLTLHCFGPLKFTALGKTFSSYPKMKPEQFSCTVDGVQIFSKLRQECIHFARSQHLATGKKVPPYEVLDQMVTD